MKKILIFIVFLSFTFFVVGCGSDKPEEERFVAIGKVNIVTGCEESCLLSLKLIANYEIEEISVVTTDATAEYEYVVSEMKTVGLEEKQVTAHTYMIDFTFDDPTSMTRVTLQLDDDIVDFDIGSFQGIALDRTLTTSTKGSQEHLKVSQVTNLDYVVSYIRPSQITLYFENLTKQNIIIKNVSIINSSDGVDVRVIKAIQPRSHLKPEETNKFAYVYFNTTDENIMHASAIVQIDYTYLGEDYRKYVLTECGYTDEILESEVIGSTITTSALVEGVVRAETTE